MHHPDTLRAWCGGSWLSAPLDAHITELAIDSRKINEPEEAVFIALKTARRDGHEFIRSAYDAGVRLFIISRALDVSLYPGASFIFVPDTVAALQAIAAQHRRLFSIPVI